MKFSTSQLFTLLALSSQVAAEPKMHKTDIPDLDAVFKDLDILVQTTVTDGKDFMIEIEDNGKSFFKDFSSSSKKFFDSAKKKQDEVFQSLFSSMSLGPQIIEIDLDDNELPTFQQLMDSPNGPLTGVDSPDYIEVVYTVVSDEPAPAVPSLDDTMVWIEPSDLSNVNYHFDDNIQTFKLQDNDYPFTLRQMDDCGSKRFRHAGRFSFVALSGLLVLLSMSLFLFPLMVILSYRRRQADRGVEYGPLDGDAPPEYPTDEKSRTAPAVVSPVVVVEEVEEEADETQPLNPSSTHH